MKFDVKLQVRWAQYERLTSAASLRIEVNVLASVFVLVVSAVLDLPAGPVIVWALALLAVPVFVIRRAG